MLQQIPVPTTEAGSRTGAGALEHILVLLEAGAVPFCHYENPRFHQNAASRWIAPSLLKALIDIAVADGIALSVLLGKTRPPRDLETLLARVPHVKIVPLELSDAYPGAIVVVSSDERARFSDLKPDRARNLILRLSRADLADASRMFNALEDKYGRLSIHLTDIENIGDTDLAAYAAELDIIAARLKKMYAAGRRIEVNVLTDRMMMTTMRNCDAGQTHVTLAPDGRFFICPAFFHYGEPAIGEFGGTTIAVNPPGTVAFSRAPLCTRCDAWHCKRCVWLNQALTGEYNVPSEQQCAIAHAEREAARRALKSFGDIAPFGRLPRITELNYRDPLDLIDMPAVSFPGQSPDDDPML